MRISHKYKFVFLSKWKCGTESIRKILDPFSDIASKQEYPYYHHTNANLLKNHFDSMGWDWNRYFVFISIRNPWDMLVSLYFYGLPDKSGKYFWDRHWNDIRQDIYLPYHRIVPENIISFSDWINNYDLSKFTLEYFASDKKGENLVDYIIKMEEIKDEMNNIGQKIGINLEAIEIPHINTTNHPEYQSFYTKKAINIVEDIFKSDIEAGGYIFDPKKTTIKDTGTKVLKFPLFQYERNFLLNQIEITRKFHENSQMKIINEKALIENINKIQSAKIDELEQEKNILANNNKALIEKNEILESQLQAITCNNIAIGEQYNNLISQSNNLIENNQKLLNEKNHLKEEIRQLNQINNELKEKNTQFIRSEEYLHGQLSSLKKEYEKYVENLKKDNYQLIDKRSQLKEEIGQLNQLNNKLNTKNTQLIRREEYLDSQLSSLKKGYEKYVEKLKNDNYQISLELKKLRSDSEGLVEGIKRYRALVSKLKDKYKNITLQVQEYNKTIEILIEKKRENKIGIIRKTILKLQPNIIVRYFIIRVKNTIISSNKYRLNNIVQTRDDNQEFSDVENTNNIIKSKNTTNNSNELADRLPRDSETSTSKTIALKERIHHLQNSINLVESLRRYEERFFASKIDGTNNWKILKSKINNNIPLNIVFVNDMGFLFGAGVAFRRQVESFLIMGHNVSCISWLSDNIEHPYFDNNSKYAKNWRGMHLLPEVTELAGKSKESVVDSIGTAVMSKSPDLIIAGNFHGVGWGAKAWPLEALIDLHNRDLPVVAYAHDCYWATGGCAYTGSCKYYEVGCKGEICRKVESDYPSCPKNEIEVNWKLRKKTFASLGPIPIATNSSWTTTFFKTAFNNNAIVKTVHLGLNTKKFKPIDKEQARKILGLSPEGFFIAVGAINIEENRKGGKDIEFLIQHYSNDNDVKWLAFGDNSSKLNVKSFGRVGEEDISLIFNAADLYVNLAKEEAFGQTLLEASACACPIISYNSGGITDVAKHDQNALCSKTGDLYEVIKNINIMRNNSELRKRIGSKGRDIAVNQFSLEVQYHNWIKFLKEISEVFIKNLSSEE